MNALYAVAARMMPLLADGAIWLFIYVPFFLGGFFITLNGRDKGIYNISLGFAGVLLIVGLMKLMFRHRPLPWQWRELSSLRLLQSAWNKWQESLAQSPLRSLLCMSITISSLYAATAMAQHWAMKTDAYDTGIFLNAIWNLVFEGEYISSFKNGMNLFADHQSPIFWLYAPLFYVFPYAETLFVIQAFVLAFGGGAAYFIAKQYFEDEQKDFVALTPFIYWFYNGVRSANLFEFHPETIILPAFLWAIVGLQSSTVSARLFGFLMVLLGLMGKESAGPLLVGLGLAFAMGAAPQQARSFTRKISPLLITLGVLSFYIATSVVPQILGASYNYSDLYQHLGTTTLDVVLSPVRTPQAFFSHILQVSRVQYILAIMLPLVFLPLFSWRHYASFAIPLLLLFLPSDNHRLGLSYHYGIEVSVGLFWAFPAGAMQVCKMLQERKKLYLQRYMFFVLVFLTLATHGLSDTYRLRSALRATSTDWYRHALIPCVHETMSISAPSNLAVQLARRPWATHLPYLHKPDGTAIACVFLDNSLNNWPMTREELALFPEQLNSEYEMIYSCRNLQIYQHRQDTGEHPCLVCQPQCTEVP